MFLNVYFYLQVADMLDLLFIMYLCEQNLIKYITYGHISLYCQVTLLFRDHLSQLFLLNVKGLSVNVNKID